MPVWNWFPWGRRARDPTEEHAARTPEQTKALAEAFVAMSRELRNVLRSGRLSGEGVGWSWNPMAFEQRRHQNAHQVDFTQLKRLSAAELLEILISTHPDISDAVWQFLRLADTPTSFTVRKLTGKEDPAGQRVLEEALSRIGAPSLGDRFELPTSIASKAQQALLTILVRAAFAVEVEPTRNLRGIQDIHLIDPADIEFRKEEDGRLVPWQRLERVPQQVPEAQRSLYQGGYKKLDSPTIIWVPLDPMPGDPHGREPLLPVLQVVFFEIQVLRDLQAVVHNQGYPRLEVEVLQEVVMQRVEQFLPQLLQPGNEKELGEYLEAELNTIADHFAGLQPDDTVVHWDSSKAKAIGVEGKGPMIDVSKLIQIIEARIATGCKTFLTLLSRHTGTAEGSRKTDVLVYQKGIAGIQKVASVGWGRALTVALNLLGRQGTVEWTYEAPDMRTPDEQERDFASRITNAQRLLDSGALDEAGFYQYVFDRTASQEDIRRMQEARKARAQPPPRGGDGNP